MNLLLIDRDELSVGGRVVLCGRRAEHLRRVLGVHVGQELRAGIVHGPHAIAKVVAINGESVEVEIERRGACPIPEIDLVLALPRPKALSRIVQAAASIGVRRIDIINAWRVDSSYFASHKVSMAALALDARLGCEQGKTTHVPEVSVHRRFVPYVQDVLKLRLAADPNRLLLVAHPSAEQAIERIQSHSCIQPTTVAVGPDGGFEEREVQSLVDLGGRVVNFGSAVLRSEVAVVAILSQLDLLRRLAGDCVTRQ